MDDSKTAKNIHHDVRQIYKPPKPQPVVRNIKAPKNL
jgi:hypothetical protein